MFCTGRGVTWKKGAGKGSSNQVLEAVFPDHLHDERRPPDDRLTQKLRALT